MEMCYWKCQRCGNMFLEEALGEESDHPFCHECGQEVVWELQREGVMA